MLRRFLLPGVLSVLASIVLIGWSGLGVSPSARADEKTGEGKTADEKTAKPNPARGGILDADSKTTGKITGVVLFKGKAPKLPDLKVKKDHKDINYCGHEIPDQAIIVNDKNQVANAVVSLVKVPTYKVKQREVTIDNVKCLFVPHLLAATKGSTLLVKSQDDGIYHSAQGLLANEFNVAITSSKTVIKQRRLRPGWTLIKCTGHEWMSAHLLVFDHDFFAITGKDGQFSIEGIPPGDYEVAVWHERLALDLDLTKPDASHKQKVTVTAGGKAEVKFEVKQP